MRLKLKPERNILLVGDLTIRVLSGRVSIFGAEYVEGSEVVVEKLTSAPLEVLEESDIEIEFGDEGYITETQIKLIPDEWKDVAEEIISLPHGSTVMLCANVDTGKSGFICYAVNRAVAKNKRVVVIGADTGQSEMNPPMTIGMALIDSHIIHLSQLEYRKAFFVGSTSPAGMLERSIVGVIKMLKEAKKLDPDIVMINTTGWVHGNGGRELKELKLLAVSPDFVVILEKEKDELNYIHSVAERMNIKYRVLPAAPRLRSRTREERRRLRTRYYAREFRDAKEIKISVDEVSFMYSYFGTGVIPNAEEILGIVNILGYKPEYMEKTPDAMIIVTERQISDDKIDVLTQTLGCTVKVFSPKIFENMVVGLLDEEANMINMGIITKFDPESRLFTIYTRADPDEIKIVAFGRIKVNLEFEEVEWLEPWSL